MLARCQPTHHLLVFESAVTVDAVGNPPPWLNAYQVGLGWVWRPDADKWCTVNLNVNPMIGLRFRQRCRKWHALGCKDQGILIKQLMIQLNGLLHVQNRWMFQIIKWTRCDQFNLLIVNRR